MRKLIVLGGVSAAIAIGITLWQGRERAPMVPSRTAVRIDAPLAPRPAVPRGAQPSPAVADAVPAPEEIRAEPLAAVAEADDGDDHGQEQGELRPLEAPPLSRDVFGADPESEIAALAEVRATLEGLLEDPDPAVKEQASALLETIAAP